MTSGLGRSLTIGGCITDRSGYVEIQQLVERVRADRADSLGHRDRDPALCRHALNP